MKKSDSIVLFQALNKLGNLAGVKFAYAVNRNLALLKPELESLEKASAPSEEYMKFEKEIRIPMVEKFAKKDDKGKPIQKDNQYEIEDQKGLVKAFAKVKEENKEVFEAREKQVLEYNELLKTDSDVVLFKISKDELPSNISVAQLNGIMAIVSEDIPSPYPTK